MLLRLQVIEAMNCGLPTFATIHGGPSEIIVVRETCLAHQPWTKDTSLHLGTAAPCRLIQMMGTCRMARAGSTSIRIMRRTPLIRWQPSSSGARKKRTTGTRSRKVQIAAANENSNCHDIQSCCRDISCTLPFAGGLKRIYECYTWKIYASRLMNLSRIYSFWKVRCHLLRKLRVSSAKRPLYPFELPSPWWVPYQNQMLIHCCQQYLSKFDRRETQRYLQMFYHFSKLHD
jgi:hypothetical protein